MHPTLAAMLAEWRLSGWAEMIGRQPETDDLILLLPPAAAVRRRYRKGEAYRSGDYAAKRWREEDHVILNWRYRELYATKSTFELVNPGMAPARAARRTPTLTGDELETAVGAQHCVPAPL